MGRFSHNLVKGWEEKDKPGVTEEVVGNHRDHSTPRPPTNIPHRKHSSVLWYSTKLSARIFKQARRRR